MPTQGEPRHGHSRARRRRPGAGGAGTDRAVAHGGRRPRATCPDRAARVGRSESAGDRRSHGPVRGDGAARAQALRRAGAARAGGGRARGTAADLLGRAEERGHRHGADPSRRSRAAVRVLDPGSPGRPLGRPGRRHAPQPDQRDLPPRGPQAAARGWIAARSRVRRAGRSGLRPQKGRSGGSTRKRRRAASSSAWTRWGRKPARATRAGGW
jgi:hypothetical protein